MDVNEQSLGKVYKAAGYKTAYIGKWHLNGPKDETTKPEHMHGFDLWIQSLGHVPFAQSYVKQYSNKREVIRDRWAPTYETEEGIKFIEENKDNPFCIVISFNPPHTSGGPGFEDPHEDSSCVLRIAAQNVPDQKLWFSV